MLPPHARGRLREPVHRFFESEVHGGYEQAADILGVGCLLHGMELQAPPRTALPTVFSARRSACPVVTQRGGAFSLPYLSTALNAAKQALQVDLCWQTRRRKPTWRRWR